MFLPHSFNIIFYRFQSGIVCLLYKDTAHQGPRNYMPTTITEGEAMYVFTGEIQKVNKIS
jgi:hypothetical protein